MGLEQGGVDPPGLRFQRGGGDRRHAGSASLFMWMSAQCHLMHPAAGRSTVGDSGRIARKDGDFSATRLLSGSTMLATTGFNFVDILHLNIYTTDL